MLRNFIILTFIFSSCNPGNRIFTRLHPHYSNSNYFSSDFSGFTLIQKIAYNRPMYIDEEFSHNIRIKFSDCPVNKRVAISDSGIVLVSYDKISVWNWDRQKKEDEIKGWIKIKSLNKDRIVIKENIRIKKLKYNEKINLKGRRVFKQQEE